MKLKIISDGTTRGTEVVNAETGEALQYVTEIEWSFDVKSLRAEAIIKLANVQMVFTGDAAIAILPAYQLLDELSKNPEAWEKL